MSDVVIRCIGREWISKSWSVRLRVRENNKFLLYPNINSCTMYYHFILYKCEWWLSRIAWQCESCTCPLGLCFHSMCRGEYVKNVMHKPTLYYLSVQYTLLDWITHNDILITCIEFSFREFSENHQKNIKKIDFSRNTIYYYYWIGLSSLLSQ